MNFRDPAKLYFIRILTEEDKLGHFSQEEIYSMMNPIIEVANSKRSVDYIFASMTSELEKILNDDTLQARVKVFDDLQETKKLTPDECPRGVFRSPTPGEVNCEPKVFMELVKTLQYFEKIYK